MRIRSVDTISAFTDVRSDVQSLNAEYDNVRAECIVAGVLNIFEGELALVSSFGADSAVLLHMVSSIDKNVPIIFLETGQHFEETLRYLHIVANQLGLVNVRSAPPDRIALAELDPDNTLYERDPDRCCAIRKKNVLAKELAPYRAWISGRKRFQTHLRQDMLAFENEHNMRVKVNPLAAWSELDIAQYFANHDLPRHPLWADGYKSIGCAPCTHPTSEGEHARVGRWGTCCKTECGIHL